jgi:uroporphyrinogen decarboxylase
METKIIKDEMTPKERMEAYCSGKEVDRIPCCPFCGESFAPHFGYTLDEFNHNPDIIVDTVIKTFKLFRPDNCSIGPGLQGLPEAMGAELEFLKYDIPRISKPAINDYSEIAKLKIVNPYKDGRLKYYIEALERIQDKVGNEVCIGNTVGGPFTTAAFLVGVAKFLKDIRKHPEEIKKVLDIATQSTLSMMDAVMDLGISPGIADPIASCTMISPKIYREFVKPYTTICQEHIAKRMGSGSVMHICGKTKGIWKDMVDTGITGLSLDNCDDIEELKEAEGHRVMIIGNVDPVGVIMNGSKENIEQEVKKCIDKAKDSKNGFILASGCDIPIGTNPQKIHDFINAARIYGRNLKNEF